jgi:hypothetical protein
MVRLRSIAREREALDDLNDKAGIPTEFVPYGVKGQSLNKGFK